MNISTTNNSITIKMSLLGLAFAFFSILGFSQSNETESISIVVTIDNVKNNAGKVLVSLHSKDTFMKGKGLQNAESKIVDGKVTVTFKDVVPGEYAIMTLHDENENNRMDFEDNGMPKESYGMSNNPMSYGPPQFTDAKFEVATEDLNLKIRF